MDSPNYPICLEVEKLVVHALWKCTAAQDTWGQCSKIFQKSYLCKKTLMELIEAMYCNWESRARGNDSGCKKILTENEWICFPSRV